MYLITALQGRATDILHGILTNAAYEETLQALEDHFEDQRFTAAFHRKLKMMTLRRESLQELFTPIEQLPHRSYPTLTEKHIR
jgi:hypothetical protein